MIIVAAGVMKKDGKYLIAQRKKSAPLALLWEFPGGKLEPGESPEQALERELFEELGIQTRTGQIIDAIAHKSPGVDILVLFYHSEILCGTVTDLQCTAHAWVSADMLKNYAFADADRRMLCRLGLLSDN